MVLVTMFSHQYARAEAWIHVRIDQLGREERDLHV